MSTQITEIGHKVTTWATWLAVLAIVLPDSYMICTAAYNLFFHPLHSYPGPKSYAISGTCSHASKRPPNVSSRTTGLPRVEPKGGEHICGKWVPGGTIVFMYQWAMYRSPQNFTDPHSFHPERFLGDPRFASDNKGALQPFHVRPRNCIGKNLAIAEIRLILAKIILNLDMGLAPDSRWWVEEQDVYVLWQKPPLVVYLTPVRRA